MAICEFCKKEMKTAKSCSYTKLEIEGKIYKREKYFDDVKCHDCGISSCGYHHFGCDWEICPKCGCQVISCECEGDIYLVR